MLMEVGDTIKAHLIVMAYNHITIELLSRS